MEEKINKRGKMKKTNKKAFTLIELMVVMAIIAVLAVLIIGAILLARHTATETQNRSNAQSVQAALEAQFTKYKEYCGAGAGELACQATGYSTAANWTQNTNGTLLGVMALSAAPFLTTTCTGTVNKSATTAQNANANTDNAYDGVIIDALTTSSYNLYATDYSCAYAAAGDLYTVH
jgi:prepilin-type N-terminal cleavage/methylation domain-containing protein